jgi:hypothetical protein
MQITGLFNDSDAKRRLELVNKQIAEATQKRDRILNDVLEYTNAKYIIENSIDIINRNIES